MIKDDGKVFKIVRISCFLNNYYDKIRATKKAHHTAFSRCASCFTKDWDYFSRSPFAAGTKPPTGGFDVEMMGFLGAGNNPMVGMTVSVAVAVEESLK